MDIKILEQALTEIYNSAHAHLTCTKSKLPAEYKGFVDERFKSLDIAKNELKKDVNYYGLKIGDSAVILKEFRMHCATRFMDVLAFSTPQHILNYGITYNEYIQSINNKQH